MQKLRNLLGLPVLIVDTGNQIGEVIEIVLDIDGAVVSGVIVSSAEWFSNECGIQFNDLVSIGRDAIMVRTAEVLREICEIFPVTGRCSMADLCDKQIFSETGLQIGILVDVYFDEITGEIKEYQVSDSLVSDLLYGRRIMPLPHTQVIGNDKLIIPESASNLLHDEYENL